MARQKIDVYAAKLSRTVQKAVHSGSAAGVEHRVSSLRRDYGDSQPLRQLAGRIKQHVIENLDQYLAEAQESLMAHGAMVHFASSGSDACRQVSQILQAAGAARVVKSKSMVSEEIHLNEHLAADGISTIETDLGEYIIQIDHDHPSHIVKPILHKSRRDIAQSFECQGLGDYDDNPETITRRARAYLRQRYLEADAAITGANFVVAQSGRLVIVTNEGNSRFCLAASRIHIALVGLEKLLPTDRDLGVFLNLLARSATGQPLTVYTEFITGPAAPSMIDGPREMHVIFVDNGRTSALASDCREILRCIRCGACMNVCPVYRQASGHAYRSTYPGPLGAVLSPLLAGDDFAKFSDLPKASSLCGACKEVCPVDIPLPDLLLKLRHRADEEGLPSPGTPPMTPYAVFASSSALWRSAMYAGVTLNVVPSGLIPVPALQEWLKVRTLPSWRGGRFRSWFRRHRKDRPCSSPPS